MTIEGESTKRVVWVLGAGFSAALGGPLLPELFSPNSAEEIRFRYGKGFAELFDTSAERVRSLYAVGLTGKMWANAEDFVDYLDTAADPRDEKEPNPHADRIMELEVKHHGGTTRVSVEALRTAARRLIAAECCGFLEGVDTLREKWRPFVRWERELLAKGDTIVSFNYDRVVETLRHARNAKLSRVPGATESKLGVVFPASEIDRGTFPECPVLKLHGSVDWKKATARDGSVTVTTPDKQSVFALFCPAEQLAIATPGPSKAREAKGFKSIWGLAKDALKQADAVVFIGFRFPETDADARAELLGAIRENNAGIPGHHLSLHVVLGLPSPQSERLEALLRFACSERHESTQPFPGEKGRYLLTAHPLFGQDFLAVINRQDLFRTQRP
jgi:hypothetical protein